MKKLAMIVSLVTVPFALALTGCAVESGTDETTAPEPQQQTEQELTARANGNARIVNPQLPSNVRAVRGTTRGEAQVRVEDPAVDPAYQTTKSN